MRLQSFKSGGARLSALLAAGGLIAAGSFAMAGPAAADGADGAAPASTGGAQAVLVNAPGSNRLITTGEGVKIDGLSRLETAGLFTLQSDGQNLQTYCIDFGHPAQGGSKYQEVDWSASKLANNPDAGKIKWILENSYPALTVQQVAQKFGIKGLTANGAAAGTQLAIWHFSDGKNGHAKDAAAEQLAKTLEGKAVNASEPTASLSLSPTTLAGKSGDKLGPITVKTTAQSVQLKLDDAAVQKKVQVVDANGKPVTSATNGEQLFLTAPKAADALQAQLTATGASATVPVGRAFTGTTSQGDVSQTMILAGSKTMQQQAGAQASWAASTTTGPVPSVSFAQNCAKGGVEVTATNKGDENFEFELAGLKYTIKPGESKSILVKVGEDQPYKISIAGPNGKSWVGKGVLNCQKGSGTPSGGGSSASPTPTATPSSSPSPSGGLAETGASSSTPMIAGIAVALLAVGGVVVFAVRRRRA
ncbi:hypothetical protein BIV57_17020 [Mangrovactinospora gilvigrisea]|uniref:Gram-positive cocci surface proteins LPxTG domain-containing protein n=1 Tax=Mangrovactinospora gilvigrisea TaxID=1428644 RepID=A0A1J7BCG3_9ACTN|nr:thioester domain-containing protein [Mangrovactinospora gilvigrisea]OIV36277.1 hypothetical protein BIV57_17020 [Mangrovactinospora gilvigrisea]